MSNKICQLVSDKAFQLLRTEHELNWIEWKPFPLWDDRKSD